MTSDPEWFLSHVVGDVDSGQGLEAEGMETFFGTMTGQALPWLSLL